MAVALLRRILTNLLLIGAAGVVLFACATPSVFRAPPLDLSAPINGATARQLAGLRDDLPRCLALLGAANAGVRPAAAVRAGECGYDDGVTVARSQGVQWRPGGRTASCAVAAALFVWEREVVQPAARELLGSRVTGIDHLGAYACRNTYGRDDTDLSEHATANAIDVAGFRLANGRTVSVLRDWPGEDAEARFLRRVRDGACRLFGTTLSPDYNAAHADHFHLDMAARGGGWFGGYCR